jgi:hypothetical protein
MYYTGIDPFTGRQVYVAQHLRDRKLQRALMQFFKPENYFEVREALRQAGRTDLIGSGCDSLIPERPPKEAIARRRKEAKEKFRGEYVHTIATGGVPDSELQAVKRRQSRYYPARGYRPGRNQEKTTTSEMSFPSRTARSIGCQA